MYVEGREGCMWKGEKIIIGQKRCKKSNYLTEERERERERETTPMGRYVII